VWLSFMTTVLLSICDLTWTSTLVCAELRGAGEGAGVLGLISGVRCGPALQWHSLGQQPPSEEVLAASIGRAEAARAGC
jgi:hypothetical protein